MEWNSIEPAMAILPACSKSLIPRQNPKETEGFNIPARIFGMDITDESPFHSTRWDLFPLENAFNFSELREETCKGIAVDFDWNVSDIDVICTRCPSRGIFERIGSFGTEICLVRSFLLVEWLVNGHEMIHGDDLKDSSAGGEL